VIVRILGEGQYDISQAALTELNECDAALEAAVSAGDEQAFGPALAALLGAVRRNGTLHAVESLDESEAILPPGDATLAEVRGLLGDDGLIPG
jgi:hypothetical protein